MSSPATTSAACLEAARSSARRGCSRSGPRRHRAGARDNRCIGSTGTSRSAASTMSACAAMPDVPVVGVPKTIDNDIGGTDHSIGFQTAVQIATDLIDRLYSTAESRQRACCEVMGAQCRMDRARGGPRRGGRRDPAARAPVRHRARRPPGEAAHARGSSVLDRRGVGGLAGPWHDGRARLRAR